MAKYYLDAALVGINLAIILYISFLGDTLQKFGYLIDAILSIY